MKFNCGPTRAERRLNRLRAKITRRLDGEKIFAWLPKRISDNECRWLEYVIRKDLRLFRNSYTQEIHGYSKYTNPLWGYTAIE